jgi:hypothetical protein
LTQPQIRRAGKLVEATWDEAMALVAQKFQAAIAAAGPDAVAFYGSGQLFSEESYTANKLFKAGIRTNNVDANARLCMASAAGGYTQVYGKDEPPVSYEDIDHAECIFLIGANPFAAAAHAWLSGLHDTHGGSAMSELRWEALAAILAFIITLGYTLYPGPYLTGAFTFIAQPLFALVILGYAQKVWRDLQSRKIL